MANEAETRTIEQIHEMALRQHRAGNLPEAEKLYRRVLGTRADANVLNNLADALASQGRGDEAIESLQQALRLNPEFVEARYNLGSMLQECGRLEEAATAYRNALKIRPELVEARNNLGNVLASLGRPQEAVEEYRRAIATRPSYAEAHANLGAALHRLGQIDKAIGCYRQSLKFNDQQPLVHHQFGIALREAGQLDEAVAVVRRVVTLRPDYAEASITLSTLLVDQGHPSEAIAAAKQAITARPNWPGGYNKLGIVLRTCGRSGEALEAFRHALAVDPNSREALANVGTALFDLARLDDSIETERHALQMYPDLIESYVTLGNALKDSGQIDEAIQSYRDALALRNDPNAADALLMSVHYSPSFTAEQIFQEHEQWGNSVAQETETLADKKWNCGAGSVGRALAADGEGWRAVPALQATETQAGKPAPPKLRIGYVSPDFTSHPAGRFLLPLLEHHDHEQFEIFCYSDVRLADAMAERLKSCADTWRQCIGLSDSALAHRVEEDGIDILVDLAMHMAGNRLGVFARKAAPIQITWLGYPSTTGLRSIDYRLSDRHLDPPGLNDAFYSEKTVRLPDCYWCYDPLMADVDVSDLPAKSGGVMTFGCLNNYAKVSEPTIDLWGQVVSNVPGSRLLVLAPEGSARKRLLDRLGQYSIDPGRIEFTGRLPRPRYMELYHRIDVSLDTFPYNGHTTSFDALWMGVPVLSLYGQTAVSRGGLSILSNLGLERWATDDADLFVEIAVDLATHLTELAQWRANLRKRLEQSPLMDCNRFAHNVESVYQQIWADGHTMDPTAI